MAEFPEDVTVEILARLPVKSVSRFKTVSKLWKNLLSSPYFARKQLKHGSKLKILFRGTRRESKFYSADYDKPDDQVTLNLPSSYLGWSYNSCDGLFLVTDAGEEDLVCIWNPSTGEHHNLPEPFPEDSTYEVFYADYGIGYDPTTEDYKVLRIEYSECHVPHKNQVCLYTLNNNSWRRLNTINYQPYASKMVLLDNKLHFLVTRSDFEESNNSELILSFDFSNEVFKENSLPHNGEGKINIIPSSCLLCVAFYMTDSYRPTDIWVMNEYGVQGSWVKSLSIKNITFIALKPNPRYLSDNAEILLEASKQAIKHSIYYESNVYKVKTVAWNKKLNMWQTEIFNESLVSPKMWLQREMGKEETNCSKGKRCA